MAVMAVLVGVVKVGALGGFVAGPFCKGIIQRPVHVQMLPHRIVQLR